MLYDAEQRRGGEELRGGGGNERRRSRVPIYRQEQGGALGQGSPAIKAIMAIDAAVSDRCHRFMRGNGRGVSPGAFLG